MLKACRSRRKFQGRTVCDGVVEVFDLKTIVMPAGLCVTVRCGRSEQQTRSVTVLHIYPINSAGDAVKAAMRLRRSAMLSL
jgi:hypothetical protein